MTESALKDALVASLAPASASDLEGLDLTALDVLRQKLLGDRTSMDQLSEAELERFIEINAKMRLTARVASKPHAGGKKAKAADVDVTTLLGF